MSETTKFIAAALLAFATAAFLLTMVIMDYIKSNGADNDFPVTGTGCAVLITLGIQCIKKARRSICKSNTAIYKNNTPSEK